ncbi:MAG: hypothetical protein IKY19_04180 [Bacteroidaceae bacterium]|nr:hypothetical protein [Bacteroidaceae bacterium]
MKKLLLTALAVLMMSGTVVATENFTIIENNITTSASENVMDKLLALIKDFTNRVNVAKTLDELVNIAEQSFKEMDDFMEKYEDEITVFEKNLTEEELEMYEEKAESAMKAFETTVERKYEELAD